MASRARRRFLALRALFYLGGTVATAAGLHTMIAGGRSVAGQGPANPAIESELRFYGAFYFAYGLTVLDTAKRVDHDAARVRALAGALFAAGLARAGGWLAAGRPHPAQLGLLAIELAGPPAVVGWQTRLSRA